MISATREQLAMYLAAKEIAAGWHPTQINVFDPREDPDCFRERQDGFWIKACVWLPRMTPDEVTAFLISHGLEPADDAQH